MKFTIAKHCVICNSKLSRVNQFRLNDGTLICKHCAHLSTIKGDFEASYSNPQEIENRIKEYKLNLEEKKKLKITHFVNGLFYMDADLKKWYIKYDSADMIREMTFLLDFSDLVNYELLEDGISSYSGGLGRAAVGALTFGAAGAIVGGVTGKKTQKTVCNKLQLKISTKNSDRPLIFLSLITFPVQTNSASYKNAMLQAQQILSYLDIINSINSSELKEQISPVNAMSTSNESDKSSAASLSEEILKLKELLDQDIITEDEFKAMKAKLVSL